MFVEYVRRFCAHPNCRMTKEAQVHQNHRIHYISPSLLSPMGAVAYSLLHTWISLWECSPYQPCSRRKSHAEHKSSLFFCLACKRKMAQMGDIADCRHRRMQGIYEGYRRDRGYIGIYMATYASVWTYMSHMYRDCPIL